MYERTNSVCTIELEPPNNIHSFFVLKQHTHSTTVLQASETEKEKKRTNSRKIQKT